MLLLLLLGVRKVTVVGVAAAAAVTIIISSGSFQGERPHSAQTEAIEMVHSAKLFWMVSDGFSK